MRKVIIGFLTALMMMVLSGCGGSDKITRNTIQVQKDGTVLGAIVADFSREYYDEIELKTMVDEEIKKYNAEAGKEAITIDSFQVEDGVVYVFLQYASAADYEAYNKRTFFYGTIEEAHNAGYDLDVFLVDAKDNEKVIGYEELLEMGDKHVVISEEPIRIRTYNKILYYSEDVTYVGSREVDSFGTADICYVVFN